MSVFDKAIYWIFDNTPILGEKLRKYYENEAVFNRFFKYAVTLSLTFWVIKGPLIYVLTEVFGVWYLLSSFIIGVVLAVIGFFLSEYWIWKKPKRKKKKNKS